MSAESDQILLSMLTDEELTLEAQARAEHRIEVLTTELYDMDEVPDDYESPALAPYCGCLTCQVRETLDAAWDPIAELARREVTADAK
jgi:hypothetical protein